MSGRSAARAVTLRVLAVVSLGLIVACGAGKKQTQTTAGKPSVPVPGDRDDPPAPGTKSRPGDEADDPSAERLPPPEGEPLEVTVVGRKWYWTVEYPDHPFVQLTSSVDDPLVTMILPEDRLVRLTVTSKDVLHALSIPALHVDVDAVPGRETRAELVARERGDYPLECAEFCGEMHEGMRGIVRVVTEAEFEAAMEEEGRIEREPSEPAVAYGQRIVNRRGCYSCHSTDGSAKVGPTWQGLWGRTETLTEGTTVEIEGADGENYLIESMLHPSAKVVAGFEPVMPSFRGHLDDEQIDAVIAYIRSIATGTPAAEP